MTVIEAKAVGAGAAAAAREAEPASTLLPEALRDRLHADPTLGAGNFLERCRAVSPRPGADYLFLEEPIRTEEGAEIGALSLDGLRDLTRRLAGWYLAQGVGEDEAVGVYVGEGVAAFLHYLALNAIGAVPALINPAMQVEVAAAYAAQNGFGRVLADEPGRRAALAAHLGAGRLLDFPEAFPGPGWAPPEGWAPFEPGDSKLVMLCHSSGTTGLPKAVEFRHRQFFDGKRERLRHFVETPGERLLSAMPHSHSAGISYLMNATLLGIPTLAMTNVVGEPVRRRMHEFRPTIVAGFPQTLVSVVATDPAPGEFGFLRRWYTMGDASHESHIRRMLRAAPGARVIDAFGSSELGMALFYRTSTEGDVARGRSIGRVVDFADARILDPATSREVPAGEPGLLAVRSPTITPGYWRRPDMTAAARRGEYFLTGDVARAVDGEFFHLDRVVDVIRTSSGPVYTLPLEEEIQQVEGVADASVLGCVLGGGRESVVALVVPERTGRGLDGGAVLDAVLRSPQLAGKDLGADGVCVAVADGGAAIPCGSTGKVLKRALRDLMPELHREFRETGRTAAGVRFVGSRADRPAGAA